MPKLSVKFLGTGLFWLSNPHVWQFLSRAQKVRKIPGSKLSNEKLRKIKCERAGSEQSINP